ncbi:AP2/ERF and B3 domain-containing transcription factor At1g50680 [Beta vulgaris subsp. vulgaris]|uniref:AP2/ERF and B3 domain-containing transcription factor At1g50680 n=1 Tax=Beta vulgaris subsp. vulgaris TaxID=3555 RepID=UPI0025490FAF|nr:AP2/ERF and B3 domain-containing transcription factor At1g50680 [Beta vulgaris subsp. vulgaris]
MEEEIVLSTMTKTDASESYSSNSTTQRPNTDNRPNTTNRPKKQNGSCSRFKGVVYQQNGHWGAQIYANHHRIWLGTFKTEAAAAAAYDSAAIKLRHGNSGEAHRNFPWTGITMYEPNFQAHYATDQVLNMIKDGSYQTKFGEYLSSVCQVRNAQTSNHNNNQNKQEGYYCQELFRKELTPSDVGKLNRLVIPKRYALKYFPINDRVSRNFSLSEFQEGEDQGGDMELIFYDKKMRSWKFRYCYWKSSQSFVFTRGWNKFVRVKELEAKDIITFYMCELKENNVEDVKKFWMIDVVKCSTNSSHKLDKEVVHGTEIQEEKVYMVEGEATNTKKDAGFRLFGVQIKPIHCDQKS